MEEPDGDAVGMAVGGAAESVAIETESTSKEAVHPEPEFATCVNDSGAADQAVKSTSSDQAFSVKPALHADSDNDDNSCPELEDLSLQNKEYRPFRDESSHDHVNEHLVKAETSWSQNSDSVSSAKSMDPTLIKRMVKSQAKRKEAKQFARRVRKSGEAAVVTKARRENWDTIKQSTGPDWF